MSVHAEPPPPLVREPRRFEYETAEQLGKGGFAICHRATLLDQGNPTGRVVALKIVKSKMEPPKLAQKFVTELQIHSKLHHPNIVDFYRAFSFQDSTYVVLEICENGSLADILKKRRCFTMPEIRRFVVQTCGAVKYLHHRNIIHRDLKTGNLFLDKDMNVKVGDFGLAAVLVSQNDLGARRTTMCGTPNYLAPEILEKGGRGHNEKVDLWAIGIIAYTLAVGKAPFHAPKREDIYKKLQTRDYQWPEVGKTTNDISQDLKDLVGSLLVHEDDRPNPDLIVSHDFFRLGYTPSRLDVRYKLGAPKWQPKPLSSEARARGYTDEWFRICKESGVGELPDGRVFSIIGGRKIRSVVKDCEKELALGKQPVVPIPSDIVYVPYPEREDWPFPTSNAGGLSEIVEEKEPSQDALAEITANDRAQAAISKPPKRATSRQHKENFAPQPMQTGEVLERPKRTRTMQTAIRTVSSSRPSRPSREIKSAPEMACIDEKPASRTPPTSPDDSEEAVRPTHKDIVKVTKKQPERVDSMDLPQARPFVSDPDVVPHSDPSTVLARASTFRNNIAQALANKPNPVRKPASSYHLPFVSKWVDYSRKHGVGYVLEDNSIGCLLNATARDPVTHVVVRNGYDELKSLHSQITSIDKLPLEFYADCGDDGIRKTEVSRDRKRTTGILWSKFARYMCNQLRQPTQEDSSEDNSNKKPTTFVRFYQRFGSVGIWGFEDGAFQFNFPDHTKLVLSPDGCYCNFTCLSVEAAEHLAACGELPFKYIKQRNLLSSSIRTLLHSTGEKGMVVRQIARANHLKEKLRFVTTVVDAWVAGGGLGCASSDTEQLKWKGPQLEDGKKQEWVTVGRYGGDAARTA